MSSTVSYRACWPSWLLAVVLASSAFSGLGAPRITEFLAVNDSGLKDEDGAFSDWIEIHNPDSTPLSLAGYFLTDDAKDLRKWAFPSVTLEAGAYLVVFASGKDRRDPAGHLHTDFQLTSDGEYLGLVAPDGVTVVSDFGPAYPPQFPNESFGGDPSAATRVWGYFSTPTPGARNGAVRRAGPTLHPVDKEPVPAPPGPLTVLVRADAVNAAVTGVRLVYRRMFAVEVGLAMVDDGTGADAKAGDGIWTAVIPGSAFGAGEMTRWRFVGTDRDGNATQEPAFRAPLDSEQYYGTVAVDATSRSELPVLHWFTANPAGAGTLSGSRGAVYYGGEFYDNVLFTLHGQSSAGFPKKSYNLDFNRTHHFRWSPDAARVADIDLLSNWGDKSKVRNVLGYEIMRESGVAAHFAFTVRVQQNGTFYSTADFVEDADETYLARAGLNPDGALYKIYGNQLDKTLGNTGTSGVEKKTRRFEGNADLQALINGCALTGTALRRYLYDNVDIPACVDLLAANSVIRNIDMHAKNWYAYRDTGRSGEWRILPWDLDLSHGRYWTTQDTYFDNKLYLDDYVVTGTAIKLVAHLFDDSSIRAMILRRIRTLSDRFLQPPPAAGTPESSLFYERRLNELSALIDPPAIVPSDARRDFEKWGSWLQGGAVVSYTNKSTVVESMAQAILRWKNEYLPGRRKFIYQSQIVGKGGEIPLPQDTTAASTNFTALVVTGAPVKIFVPTSGSLGVTWTGDPAREPFATAAWTSGTTGVGYERATGYESVIRTSLDTLLQNNNSVYLRIQFDVTDPAAFDRLQLRMKYDDGFVAWLNGTPLVTANAPDPVQWNSSALVSREANVSAFTIFDVSDKVGALRAGRNVLAIQGLNDSLTSSDMLIIPELHAGKSTPATVTEPRITFGTIEANPASGNQDEEYIQLVNTNSIAVDVSDWRLVGGVTHHFPGGTVLPPKGVLYLSPDAAAFRARTTSPKGGEGLLVQGGYHGHLSNFGEPLLLLDVAGGTNATATYLAHPSDAQRFLVVSEILYHPTGDGLAEFVELLNTSTDVTLDLTGVRFTVGVQFDFTGSAVTSLAPGRRVVVVRDSAAFAAVHGTNRPVAGAFTGGSALSNGGETLKLEDVRGSTILEFAYGTAAPWPVQPNSGYSLVLVDPTSRPDPAVASHWRASTRPGGNPGGPDDGPGFVGDPFGDANGNGERDLVDYALGNGLGLPPILPRLAVVPDPLDGSPTLRLSYPLDPAAVGVDVAVRSSTDLVTWLDATAFLELVSRESRPDGRELITWRVKSPLRDGPRVYLRLQVTAR